MIDEFENGEREIRLVAIAARARGDFEAERLALDRLMQFDDGLTAQIRLLMDTIGVDYPAARAAVHVLHDVRYLT